MASVPDGSFTSTSGVAVVQAIVFTCDGLSALFSAGAILTYGFLYWWNKKFVDQTITRMTIASICATFIYSCVGIPLRVITNNIALCKITGSLFRTGSLAFHWINFLIIFHLQLIVVHRVKNHQRLEKWYYPIAIICSVAPNIYPITNNTVGYIIQPDGHCDYVRYGSARAFFIWWASQFMWVVLVMLLNLISLTLVVSKVRKSLRKVRKRNFIQKQKARHMIMKYSYRQLQQQHYHHHHHHHHHHPHRMSRHPDCRDRRKESLSAAEEGNQLAIQFTRVGHSVGVLRILLKRLLWIPLVPIITQTLFIIGFIVNYCVGHMVLPFYGIGLALINLLGFFMSFAFFTEPTVKTAIQIIKGEFTTKWYDEQQEYWIEYLLYYPPELRSKKAEKWANKITKDFELLPTSFGRRSQRNSDEYDNEFELRPEYYGLRAKFAYWICQKFFT